MRARDPKRPLTRQQILSDAMERRDRERKRLAFWFKNRPPAG